MTTNTVYVPRRTCISEARVINSPSLSRCGTLSVSIKGIFAAWMLLTSNTRKLVIHIVHVSGDGGEQNGKRLSFGCATQHVSTALPLMGNLRSRTFY